MVISKFTNCLVCSKALNKRAQIFLLAAVIVSAIIISLGITANQAKVSSDPKDFYDFSYEVKREVGAVMDYEIYTNFSEDDDLEEFIDILAENIQDINPGTNFMFIYGNNKSMILKNYGSKKSNMTSEISIGSFYKKMENPGENSKTIINIDETELENANEIIVEIKKNKFSLPISDYRQVIFLMQKDIKDESFVTFE